MAFTVNDVQDLTRVLALHPEWKSELRRLILTDELLNLPDLVRELVEAQKRAEARMDSLETAVRELVEAQKRTEARVEELVEAQKRTEARIDRLEATTQRLVNDVGRLKGRDMERQYIEKAGAYFGRWLWPVAAIPLGELRPELEARLDVDKVEEIMRLDVLIKGRARGLPGTPELWLALEVSAVIDRGDVERARRRAALLERAGYRAIPAVAGEELTEGAERLANETPILVIKDGSSRGWEEALGLEQNS
ncbi:MAG: hypothetical protein JW850_20530 [Thermoflexales bacterium]|nr:hypothetical protein [Thermoflexales bacterium]